MEAEGARHIFQRSAEYGFRYKYLVWDGDVSAYEMVKDTYIKQRDEDEENTNDQPTSESFYVTGASAEAVIIFNRDRVGLLPFFDTLGLDVNYSLLDSSLVIDSKRLAKAQAENPKKTSKFILSKTTNPGTESFVETYTLKRPLQAGENTRETLDQVYYILKNETDIDYCTKTMNKYTNSLLKLNDNYN
ncbi:unnamed protein product [Didymodactylos carnosus]|uniref:Uncharacterized protein n=1 Tax=Didymodactylos carnosus TaxID=1234261 RepID=A0A815F1Z0_9BILA|nr:unnamed protein product [Didymodactylos carnosus]CAF1317752.1 unnamed protein product [Didymodactylos carnosus]CAF3928045.1 unnamed protein product [Didymodactylos carnosus]CAF4161185.1 unnamed protein product [Didymodactylos carnosus]